MLKFAKGNLMNKNVLEYARNYVLSHLDKSDVVPEFDVYIVWKCYILGNDFNFST